MKAYTDKPELLKRIVKGPYASPEEAEWNGQFVFRFDAKTMAGVQVSDKGGWEHVSVHIEKLNARRKVSIQTPNWDQMCKIKDLFWLPSETVIQYHPSKEIYVNTHPHVLHLWRPYGYALEISLPPKEFV